MTKDGVIVARPSDDSGCAASVEISMAARISAQNSTGRWG
jgi:hypothetical protein